MFPKLADANLRNSQQTDDIKCIKYVPFFMCVISETKQSEFQHLKKTNCGAGRGVEVHLSLKLSNQ